MGVFVYQIKGIVGGGYFSAVGNTHIAGNTSTPGKVNDIIVWIIKHVRQKPIDDFGYTIYFGGNRPLKRANGLRYNDIV